MFLCIKSSLDLFVLLLIVSYCRFGIREFAEASFVIKAKG